MVTEPRDLTTPQALGVLLRASWRMTLNTLKRSSALAKAGLAFGLVLGAWLIFLLYGLTTGVVRFLQSPTFERALRLSGALPEGATFDPQPYLAAVPSVAFFVVTTVLLLTGFASLINVLYLSNDLETMLVAPVPMRAVFLLKFFEAIWLQYLIIVVGLLPVLLGFGRALDYDAVYYVAAVLGVVLSPLLPVGLASLLVMAVMRIVAPRRALEILGFLASLVMLGVYLLSQLGGRATGARAGTSVLPLLRSLDMPFLPSAWAGRALVAAGEGEGGALLLYGGLFLAASIAVFLLCLRAAERLYYGGWASAAEGDRPRRRVQRAGQPGTGRMRIAIGERLAAALPAQVGTVFLKDWRLFPRDLSRIQNILYPLALTAIWAYQLIARPPPVDPEGAPASVGGQLFSLAGVGIVFYLCVAIAGTVAGNPISREGRAFWILRAAPVSGLRIVLGKLALGYLPYLVIGGPVLAVMTALGGIAPGDFAANWAVLLLAGLGVSSLTIGIDATFPKFDAKDPQRQTSVRAGCLTSLSYPLFLGTLIVAVAGPPLVGSTIEGSPALATGLAVAGWALAVAATAAIAWFGLRLGARAIERIEL